MISKTYKFQQLASSYNKVIKKYKGKIVTRKIVTEVLNKAGFQRSHILQQIIIHRSGFVFRTDLGVRNKYYLYPIKDFRELSTLYEKYSEEQQRNYNLRLYRKK